MANAHVYIEVEPGPVMRTGLDVLEYAVDLLGCLPEWHEAEREELASRCRTLSDTLEANAELVEHGDEDEYLSMGTA